MLFRFIGGEEILISGNYILTYYHLLVKINVEREFGHMVIKVMDRTGDSIVVLLDKIG